MKLSTKGRYGLRAILDIASHSGEGAASISSIAARQSLSESYLEQLMGKLKKARLINSVRGAQGGYYLARPPSEISVGDVLRALEGDLTPVTCSAISASGKKITCKAEKTCVTKYVWRTIGDSINAAVDGISLDMLIREESAGQVYAERECER